ncbi:V-type ATP synthase subunit F [Euryarchaeota archaeon ex4484_178]|nr:MAG: V-type ATP synthase subunit F [Euryarchaeota archaeon ex4484_178]
MRIVAVGDRDFVAGFRLAGVEKVYEANNAWNARNVLEMIREMQGIAIVIVQRRFARELRDFMAEWKAEKGIYPVILELPDHRERGEYEDPMREIIKRAIGIDILKR